MLAEHNVRATDIATDDWEGLRTLPWGVPLDDWILPELEVDIIDQRRGMSRHPVLFVHAGGRKYAIKGNEPRCRGHRNSQLSTHRAPWLPITGAGG